MEAPLKQLNVFPAQPQHFPAAERCPEHGQGGRLGQGDPASVSLVRGVEEVVVGGSELGDLGFGEDGHLGLLESGTVDRIDGVRPHLPPLDRPFDHHPQQGQVVGDCFGGEPCCCFRGDVGVDQLGPGFQVG